MVINNISIIGLKTVTDKQIYRSSGLFPSEQYVDENEMPAISELIARDLSEPYSIYTYRYVINNWPN